MSKLLRVSQLDAIQLDNEIIKIFKSCVDSATKYLSPGFTVPFEPEINLIIRLLVLKYSLFYNDATFGQKLLLIKYENLTDFKKILYIFLSSLSYVKDRCELSNPSHKINQQISSIELATRIFDFINLTKFLQTGVKPQLIDRILGLNQIYVRDNIPRQFGNKYLTRELLWNGFIELFVFILPLINYHKIKRMIRSVYPFYTKPNIARSMNRTYNLYTRCPHCKDSPIHPHHMGCAHIFCYICLKSNQLADPKYECSSCGYSELICERVVI